MTAEPLCVRIRWSGQTRIGKLTNGLNFEQIGPDAGPAASYQFGPDPEAAPHGHAIRFRGQIYSFCVTDPINDGGAYSRINVFDEHGTNDWYHNGVAAAGNTEIGNSGDSVVDSYPRNTAKGGYGIRYTHSENERIGETPYFIIVTADGDYLVFAYAAWFTDDPRFYSYNASSVVGSVHGHWQSVTPSTTMGSTHWTSQAFAHGGLLYYAYGASENDSFWSYNPATNSAVQHSKPFTLSGRHHYFFSLFDRVFMGDLDETTGPFNSQIAEFTGGNWALAAGAANVRLGSDTRFTRAACFQISIDKVLVFAYGTDLATGTIGGFQCRLFTTVGGTPGGALTFTDETAAVITASGYSFTGGQSQGCYGYTSTSDPLGQIEHYLYWTANTVTASPVLVYKVTDELTPLSLHGTTDVDSHYAMPYGYYGGGEVENGIDQSTRLITVSPRGWEAGTTGLKIKCGAHGDPMVLAHSTLTGKTLFHGAVTSGPFQVGETVTGGSSAVTATVAGIGASGMHVTSVSGVFAPGETITGGTSGASAVMSLNANSVWDTYTAGETVTGGSSGATATVVNNPTRAHDEYLRNQVGIMQITGVTGIFTSGENVTGSIAGVSRTIYSPSDATKTSLNATFIKDEGVTGLTSGATGIVIGEGAAEGLLLRETSGTFQAGEEVQGDTTGTRVTLNTVLVHGSVTSGPFTVGETVTGGTSLATGVVTHVGGGGLGELYVKVDTVVGTFQNGEVVTGGTSGASTTLSAAPAGHHGGAANKTIRVRYFHSATGPSGIGVPVTGYCTFLAGSGVRCTVSKGTGPGGSDELTNVVADGTVGSDNPIIAEWDFISDGVPQFLASNLGFEIDRI